MKYCFSIASRKLADFEAMAEMLQTLFLSNRRKLAIFGSFLRTCFSNERRDLFSLALVYLADTSSERPAGVFTFFGLIFNICY